jgi:hypothetical protein
VSNTVLVHSSFSQRSFPWMAIVAAQLEKEEGP